jgi:hypothetical protein
MLKPLPNGIGGRKVGNISQPLSTEKVGPEHSPWYWNPNRVGVKFAPDWFLTKLHDLDPDLTITWSPIHENWIVWMKSPRIQSPLCTGWALLFIVKESDNSYRPLDERIFARLFSASARKWGKGRDYFLAIEREMERDREKKEKNRNDDVRHSAGEYYDFMKIKNIGKGSKFANHFS